MGIANQALFGGILIGCSAALLLVCDGPVAGISGIVNGVYPNSAFERTWRLLFLLGLMFAAGILFHFIPASRPHRTAFPIGALLIDGLLVGIGTRMGKWCASGHGVCRLARLSARSLIAVLVFMATAILTVAVTHHFSLFS